MIVKSQIVLRLSIILVFFPWLSAGFVPAPLGIRQGQTRTNAASHGHDRHSPVRASVGIDKPKVLIRSMSTSSNNNSMEWLKTFQTLSDKRRQNLLKQDLRKQFPLIPGDMLDACIDMAAQGFATVAPAQLQKALTPGGMAKIRPSLRDTIVDNLLEQKGIQDLPILKPSDKKRFLTSLVDLALDYLLKDAQEILAAPEVRLLALERQQEQIFRLLGPWKSLFYRIRYHPRTAVVVLLVTAFAIFQLVSIVQSADLWLTMTY